MNMETLVNQLNFYAEEYYSKSISHVDDKEYDRLYSLLCSLEKSSGIILPNSPTQKIGGEPLDAFEKHTHKAKLWSLDKAQTLDDLKDWHKKNVEFIKNFNANNSSKLPEIKYIVTKKFDGLTLNCTFDDKGDLIVSASRGNGDIGENITKQSKTIINLPSRISKNFVFEVHGEALMTKKAFEEYNLKNPIPLKNLRNGAAGALRNLDPKETAKRKLISYFYDVGYIDGKEFKTYTEMLEFIKESGLPMDDYIKPCHSIDDIVKEYEYIKSIRENLPYDIDGIVIAIDDIRTRELLGYTVKFPKWAIAFKFDAEEAITTINGVEWNVSRTGRINPIAILEPVDIMGTTIRRATLNNLDDISKKEIMLNSVVSIRRSNDVIPEILEVLDKSSATNIFIPTVCPSCGHEVIKEGPYIFCPNTLECKPQLVNSISHYCSRDCMNIPSLSVKTIESLVENNLISSIVDLYSLSNHKDAIINLERFGEKKYFNIVEAIESTKNGRKLNDLIFALGIHNVGKKTSKDLCVYFNYDIEKIQNATVEDFLKVNDIGEIIANSLYEWFRDTSNLSKLDSLLSLLNLDKPEISVTSSIFTGKTIVVTGTLSHFSRNEIKEKLESLGAKVTGSVSKKTDYLLYGEEAGSKLSKAKDLGVNLLTEAEFLKLI